MFSTSVYICHNTWKRINLDLAYSQSLGIYVYLFLSNICINVINLNKWIKRKTALKHTQTVQIQIILRKSTIRAFVLHSYSLQYTMIRLADSEGPDQTARMRRLIWTFAVRMCPRTHFRMAWPIVSTMLWKMANSVDLSKLFHRSVLLCHPGISVRMFRFNAVHVR